MGAPASAYPGRAVVDLDAIRANTAELRRRAGQAELMGIVKANAYGHGLVPSARAALAGGATWLGAAQLTEALALRAAIPGPPILAWLFAPGAPLREAVRAGIDLGVASDWALDAVGRAARAEGVQARVHLKIDTGLGRSGVPPEAWEAFVGRALRAEADGLVRALGCWSHFAYADAPDHPTVRAQKEVFRRAVETAEDLGARFEVRHLANSAALVTDAGANFDLVRPGLALYGLSPIPDIAAPAQLGLVPAMRLESTLLLTKDVPAGQGVSYGHTHTTARATRLGLVPLGYSDGVPRHASNAGPVRVGGRNLKVAGRVCMDQFVLDLGPGAADSAGDPVILFGSGADGGPTAEDWAAAAGTISYEIVTRLPAHLPRVYTGMGE